MMLLSFTQIHFRLRYISVPRPLGAFAWLLHCLIYKVQFFDADSVSFAPPQAAERLPFIASPLPHGLSSVRISVRPLSGELNKYTIPFSRCQARFFHIFDFFVQIFARRSKGTPKKAIDRFTAGTVFSDNRVRTCPSGAIRKLSASMVKPQRMA